MLLTETNIPDIIYCHNHLGYYVVWSWSTVAKAGISQGGVRLFLQERLQGKIYNSMRFHWPNGVNCKNVSGNQRTPLIGLFLPPSTMVHIPDLEDVLNSFLGREYVILVGLNAEIVCLNNSHDQQVPDLLVFFGFLDLLVHFCQFLRHRHLQTWWQVV